jgi:hypothetical protein
MGVLLKSSKYLLRTIVVVVEPESIAHSLDILAMLYLLAVDGKAPKKSISA